MKWLVVFLILFKLTAFNLYSQIIREVISEEIEFTNHLYQNKYFQDQIYVLNKLDKKTLNEFGLSDTINYLIGRSYFKLNLYDSSYNYYTQLNPDFFYYQKCQLYRSWIQAKKRNYESSKSILGDISSENVKINELKYYNLLSVALLNNDLSDYEQNLESATFYISGNRVKDLNEDALAIMSFKKKSPFLAGTFSAIIPGTGKIYAGKTGEGLSSFLIISSLGLITYENYRKCGIDDFKTILFGSIFSVFYIGNIWGSVFSVKRNRADFKNEMEQKILNDMYYTLDSFYKQ